MPAQLSNHRNYPRQRQKSWRAQLKSPVSLVPIYEFMFYVNRFLYLFYIRYTRLVCIKPLPFITSFWYVASSYVRYKGFNLELLLPNNVIHKNQQCIYSLTHFVKYLDGYSKVIWGEILIQIVWNRIWFQLPGTTVSPIKWMWWDWRWSGERENMGKERYLAIQVLMVISNQSDFSFFPILLELLLT